MRSVQISVAFLGVALLFLARPVPTHSQTAATETATPQLPYLLDYSEWSRWPDRVMANGVRTSPSAGSILTPNVKCAMLLGAALRDNQSIATTGAQIDRYLPNTRVWCTDAMKQVYANRAEHPTPTSEPTPGLALGQSLVVAGLPEWWYQADDRFARPVPAIETGAGPVGVPNPKCAVLLEFALRTHQEEALTAAQIARYLPHTEPECTAAMKRAYALQEEYEKRETPASSQTP
jgi:hypothetical protein